MPSDVLQIIFDAPKKVISVFLHKLNYKLILVLLINVSVLRISGHILENS